MKTVIAFLFIVLCAWPIWGAPAISGVSGTISHGETITISGTGFGTHADYSASDESKLNAGWKDFEDGSLTGGGFSHAFDGAFAENWRLVTGGRSGSSYFGSMSYVVDERGALEFTQNNTSGEWYISFWFMMPPNCQSGKFFRIYGSSPAENIYLSSGCENYQIRGYSECTSCGTITTQWGSPNSFQANTWHRVEIWIDENPSTFTVWMDGKQQWTKSNWVYNPFRGNGHTIDIGNVIDSASRGCGIAGSYNYDDVYIDYTRARVEIGNASTFSSCTHREIQIPTAWAAGEITATVNAGSFEGGTAYLYVIDSTGDVSDYDSETEGDQGYPITLGGSSPSTPSFTGVMTGSIR